MELLLLREDIIISEHSIDREVFDDIMKFAGIIILGGVCR